MPVAVRAAEWLAASIFEDSGEEYGYRLAHCQEEGDGEASEVATLLDSSSGHEAIVLAYPSIYAREVLNFSGGSALSSRSSRVVSELLIELAGPRPLPSPVSDYVIATIQWNLHAASAWAGKPMDDSEENLQRLRRSSVLFGAWISARDVPISFDDGTREKLAKKARSARMRELARVLKRVVSGYLSVFCTPWIVEHRLSLPPHVWPKTTRLANLLGLLLHLIEPEVIDLNQLPSTQKKLQGLLASDSFREEVGRHVQSKHQVYLKRCKYHQRIQGARTKGIRPEASDEKKLSARTSKENRLGEAVAEFVAKVALHQLGRRSKGVTDAFRSAESGGSKNRRSTSTMDSECPSSEEGATAKKSPQRRMQHGRISED